MTNPPSPGQPQNKQRVGQGTVAADRQPLPIHEHFQPLLVDAIVHEQFGNHCPVERVLRLAPRKHVDHRVVVAEILQQRFAARGFPGARETDDAQAL